MTQQRGTQSIPQTQRSARTRRHWKQIAPRQSSSFLLPRLFCVQAGGIEGDSGDNVIPEKIGPSKSLNMKVTGCHILGDAFWKSPPDPLPPPHCGYWHWRGQGLMSSLHQRCCVILSRFSPQGASARIRWKGPVVQRDPKEKEGKEGEETAEEGGRLQPARPHLLHTQQ